MKILFLADIVAKPGRKTVAALLSNLKAKFRTEVVIANAENLKGGRGATAETLKEMMDLGVDYFTSGNHIFYQKDFDELLDDDLNRIIRPANYPDDVPGRGYTFANLPVKGKLLLINLSGLSMMKGPLACPFRTIDSILAEINPPAGTVIIVDFHAEATSEKQALGFYLDGKVTAVLGTHTHVATADARILPKGTGYVTDVGMIGSLDSVLGVKKEMIIQTLMYPYPSRFVWEEEGSAIFNSVLIETKDGLTKSIKRIDQILEA